MKETFAVPEFHLFIGTNRATFGVFHSSLRERDKFSKKPKGPRTNLSHFFPEVDPELKWT